MEKTTDFRKLRLTPRCYTDRPGAIFLTSETDIKLGISMKRGRGGVKYEDIAIGDGAIASRGSRVEVTYDLYLNRGDLVEANQRYSFRVGARIVIAGLEYGVEGMRVGGRRHLRIAPHLAYRDQAVPGSIPANALLNMHVTLVSVVSDTKEPHGDA